jgi:hypothetical protein
MVLMDSDKLRKIANYIAASQEIIRKQASQEAGLRERVPQVIDTLVGQGLVSQHLKASKTDELVENPVELCGEVEKVAALTLRKPVGEGVDGEFDKEAGHAETANELFERRIMG